MSKALDKVRPRPYRVRPAYPGLPAVWCVPHPEIDESYSSRDARDILFDAGLIDEKATVTFVGSDLYEVE